MSKDMLLITVNNLHVNGKLLVGDLEYVPYYIYIKEYIFRDGDVIVEDENGCHVKMSEEQLLDMAYDGYI
jgi:hypothetical protein